MAEVASATNQGCHRSPLGFSLDPLVRLFNLAMIEKHAAKGIKFMGECQTRDWYCARGIADSTEYHISHALDPVGPGAKCSSPWCTINCVQLARFETNGGPRSKCYQARVVERESGPL